MELVVLVVFVDIICEALGRRVLELLIKVDFAANVFGVSHLVQFLVILVHAAVVVLLHVFEVLEDCGGGRLRVGLPCPDADSRVRVLDRGHAEDVRGLGLLDELGKVVDPVRVLVEVLIEILRVLLFFVKVGVLVGEAAAHVHFVNFHVLLALHVGKGLEADDGLVLFVAHPEARNRLVRVLDLALVRGALGRTVRDLRGRALARREVGLRDGHLA